MPRCLHYLDAIQEEAGGVVRAVLDLTDALAKAGIDVTLLTGDPTDAPADWLAGKPGRPRVVQVTRSITPTLAPAGADREAVRQEIAAADVVHLHTPWDRYNLTLAAEARRQQTPYVVSIHGMLDDWCIAQRGLKKRVYLQVAGRKMLERAARLHFTAEDERRQALKWAPAATGAVLPLVMDLSAYEQLPGNEPAQAAFGELSQPGPKLLFLSRIHPKKGIELLIETVALLKSRGTDARALVAGPGEESYIAELKRLADKRGVADAVHLLGMVRGKEKLSLYQASDLFVLPTSQENFGIVLTEAMACGTPVVTTRGVDIWRELQERGAEIVDRSAEAIADAVERLLADPAALADRGARSRSGVLQWLDPESVVQGYVDLYREVASARADTALG